MLIEDVMKQIHVKYEHNIDYFPADSEDFLVRLALVNDKINMWENESGILWRELYRTVTAFTDETGSYLLTDFILPANRLEVGYTYYEYISPELLQEDQKFRPGRCLYTVDGGDGEKMLRLFPNPGVANFSLRYYARARQFITGIEAQHLDMSDPYFVIYAVVAELHLDDGDTEKSSVALQIATQKLDGMKFKNAAVPVYVDPKQPDYNFNGFGN